MDPRVLEYINSMMDKPAYKRKPEDIERERQSSMGNEIARIGSQTAGQIGAGKSMYDAKGMQQQINTEAKRPELEYNKGQAQDDKKLKLMQYISDKRSQEQSNAAKTAAANKRESRAERLADLREEEVNKMGDLRGQKFQFDMSKFGHTKKMDETKQKQAGEKFELEKKLTNARINKLLREPNEGEFKSLPQEKQIQIKEHAKSLAKKNEINNALGGILTEFINAPNDDQKVVIGRQSLKALNSTFGPDAIGVDEAKRLGGLLEHKKGNLTEPGSFWGRDLDMFQEQLESKIRENVRAIQLSKKRIETIYGRGAINSAGGASNKDKQALEWLKKNPEHPSANTVRNKLKKKGLLNE